MKQLGIALALAAAVLAAPAAGKTLRWASQGDPQTADPFSQNEGLTNMFSQSVHDTLVMRDNALRLVPGLAVSWQQVNPTTWRFSLRRGVRFHDGTPFTADDVVFSYERAQHANSQLRQYAAPVGRPRRIDDHTVEFVQDRPNPITLEHATTIYIMSKAWALKNKVERPLDFKGKEETFASRNANGTGAWILASREPGVKTVLKRNPDWWGAGEGRAPGNVTEVVYTQVSADATRTAALLSGQIDFVLDPPPQDLARLDSNRETKVVRGQENRIVFFGFDQSRDELLYSNVKGRNPFKDVRVRRAVYHAIDIDALRVRTMRGSALPTGGMTPATLPSSPEIEQRLPHDPAAARTLLGEAGFADGFGVTLDCVNVAWRAAVCQAIAGMLAQVGIRVTFQPSPSPQFFPKLTQATTSFFEVGWTPATDAWPLLNALVRSFGDGGLGAFNAGRYSNPRLDAIIDAIRVEPDIARRRRLVADALAIMHADLPLIPLYRRTLAWAMRPVVDAVIWPNDILELRFVRMQ